MKPKRNLIPIWLLCAVILALPAAVQAQLSYTNNGDGTATITSCEPSYDGAVTIPSSTNGLTVTGISTNAFYDCTNLTSVTIGTNVTSLEEGAFADCTSLTNVVFSDSITNIGSYAFTYCSSLTSVIIPSGVTSIEYGTYSYCSGLTTVVISSNITSIEGGAFADCTGLLNITIPDSVTSIVEEVFWNCSGLTSITIPGSITNIGANAFGDCTNLASVFFTGNAPTVDPTAFWNFYHNNFGYGYWAPDNATIYYLPGMTGWVAFSADNITGLPVVLWNPQVQTGGGFGVLDNQFGFNITGTTNIPVVVEACTNLANPLWSPVSTNTLTGGSSYFSDPQWTNYPCRFYRLSSP
jgi:hypothetical protein